MFLLSGLWCCWLGDRKGIHPGKGSETHWDGVNVRGRCIAQSTT